MPINVNLNLQPAQAANTSLIKTLAGRQAGLSKAEIGRVLITRKSIDARRGKIKVNLGVEVYKKDEPIKNQLKEFDYKDVTNKPEVIIVGAGPAGLFAALRLIEQGIKPVVIERGKDVSSRKRDVAMLNRNKEFNPESNFAFGEGGAGTFSDGKLYTRAKKRGSIARILSILHAHGAQDEILYEAHPHIGTNILPRVITAIRRTIEQHGGEVLFNRRVVDFSIEFGQVKGVVLSDGSTIKGKAVILATGHSARDVYTLLHKKNILVEPKPFAMGVRVEHPQALIDSIQYHGTNRDGILPAATYSLACQVEGRGVYSFCMCPGGFIVPAVSSLSEVVVNGMSPSRRNSKWANSGIVVEVTLEDTKQFASKGPLAGIYYQAELERMAFKNRGGEGFVAPAQRLDDFVDGKASSILPDCSYQPGISSSPLHSWLPNEISTRLQEGFRQFDKKMKGFITNEALVVGVESRTSSPVRIPRDERSLQHIQVKGLYPCGEGAGYAGGIASSAIDGERCADALAAWLAINF